MRLLSFGVNKLFGSFCYKFDVLPDRDIFLLTGPNGYGKTTILTILDELAKRNLYYFYMLPFEQISLKFDTGDSIFIEEINERHELVSDTDDVEISPERKVQFRWLNSHDAISTLYLDKRIIIDAIPRYMSFGRQRDLLDDIKSKRFSRFIAENSDAILMTVAERQNAGQFLLFLRGLSVRMLPSDRLLLPPLKNGDVPRLSIEEVSAQLKSLLHKYYIDYLESVNQSNRGLFEKLLGTVEPLTRSEYELKREILLRKIVQLYKWGLSSEQTIRPYDESHREVLSVYIREMERNLQVYESIYSKLLLFQDLLASKTFVNKTVLFHPTEGLVVRSNGIRLDLGQLSSGEQHEIIMAYYSIFGVTSNSILLIDEPENSLHVVWQNHYLDEMAFIARTLKIQILIATHSPQIIGGRWDECYDLYEAGANHEFDKESISC